MIALRWTPTPDGYVLEAQNLLRLDTGEDSRGRYKEEIAYTGERKDGWFEVLDGEGRRVFVTLGAAKIGPAPAGRPVVTGTGNAGDEIAVTGHMERSHAAFERACKALIVEEVRGLSPNNALVSVLCDAVRCSRECVALATRGLRP